MAFAFHKMHVLGNDFVIIDARRSPVAITPARARAIADRHTGIGCDQLITLEPATDGADVAMRIWNADGGEVSACGNAARAVGVLIGPAMLSTAGGAVRVDPVASGVSVQLAPPRFAWDEIPLAYPLDTMALPLAWGPLASPQAINVGNPHLVFLVDDVATVDLARLGPEIEHDALFPERINVNVASVRNGALHLRTWERGAGLTRACGTGACASAVAAIRAHRISSPVTVKLAGGTLQVAWKGDGRIRMTGPAVHVFTGEAELEAFDN